MVSYYEDSSLLLKDILLIVFIKLFVIVGRFLIKQTCTFKSIHYILIGDKISY